MTRLRLLIVWFGLLLSTVARPASAGEPVTPTGIDVIVGDAQGAPGDQVAVAVRFVAGPDDGATGGPDQIASLQFTLDFAGLEFDPTDVFPAEDGIPDAIVFNPDRISELDAFALIVLNPETAANDGFLNLAVTDPTRTHSLPNATLIQTAFHIPQQASSGGIAITLRNVAAKDTHDTSEPVDEAVDGVVTVLPATTPSAVSTPTPTGTPTLPSATSTATVRLSATPRRTATPVLPTETPPPGCVDFNGSVICPHSDNGGCAIARESRGSWFPLVFAMMIVAWRRRSNRR